MWYPFGTLKGIREVFSHWKVVNLDFDARVPIPFSIFPSSYRSDVAAKPSQLTQTHVEGEISLPHRQERVGREGLEEDVQSSYSQTLQLPPPPQRQERYLEEEVRIHREEEDDRRSQFRPSRKEEVYIREERRWVFWYFIHIYFLILLRFSPTPAHTHASRHIHKTPMIFTVSQPFLLLFSSFSRFYNIRFWSDRKLPKSSSAQLTINWVSVRQICQLSCFYYDAQSNDLPLVPQPPPYPFLHGAIFPLMCWHSNAHRSIFFINLTFLFSWPFRPEHKHKHHSASFDFDTPHHHRHFEASIDRDSDRHHKHTEVNLEFPHRHHHHRRHSEVDFQFEREREPRRYQRTEVDVEVHRPQKSPHETEIDFVERQYRSRYQPSYKEESVYETTVDPPARSRVSEPNRFEEVRVTETTVDPPSHSPARSHFSSKPKSVYREDIIDEVVVKEPRHSKHSHVEDVRVSEEVVKTAPAPPKSTTGSAFKPINLDMGYYDDEGKSNTVVCFLYTLPWTLNKCHQGIITPCVEVTNLEEDVPVDTRTQLTLLI